VEDREHPTFALGERVRVVPSERHQTLRVGIIREMRWHFKHARYYYYLNEDGKKVHPRYSTDDLERVS
jgi:hypothetical protein